MNKTDIPSPFYAAAGAGELAYEKLRKLPELASRTAEELRQRLATRDRDINAELARVRESAQRGTAVVVAGAATAQERAVTGYRNLVARGERAVGSRIGTTTGRAEPANIEVEVGPVQAGTRRRARASTKPEA
jgi:hypothetical protein